MGRNEEIMTGKTKKLQKSNRKAANKQQKQKKTCLCQEKILDRAIFLV